MNVDQTWCFWAWATVNSKRIQKIMIFLVQTWTKVLSAHKILSQNKIHGSRRKKLVLQKCYFWKHFGVPFFVVTSTNVIFWLKFANTEKFCQCLHIKKFRLFWNVFHFLSILLFISSSNELGSRRWLLMWTPQDTKNKCWSSSKTPFCV